MIVLIDGQEVECLNDVKVIWEGHVEEYHERIDNHLTLTYEGAIVDKVHSDGSVVATQCVEADDLFNILLDDQE